MEHLIAWLAAERGRRKMLAERLRIGPSALSQWQRVPADRCADVAAITGIPTALLRPDVFRETSSGGDRSHA